MSFLDLYQGDQAIAARTQPNERAQLPATFTEAYDAAHSEGTLFASSMASENARMAALSDYLDEVKTKTGKNLGANIDYGAAAGGAPISSIALLPQINQEAETHGLPTLSDDDLSQRAVEKSRGARKAAAEMAMREKGPGGTIGGLLGGVATAAQDPVNLLGLFVAPEAEVGVLGAALRWALIGGVSQGAIEAISAPYREEVQPGYGTSFEPALNVVEAALFAGGLGGATKALGNAWTRVATGSWPRSVRDAGNILESEAQVANVNRYPGADGEVAHRTAMQKAIDDTIGGRTVDVDENFTPSILAGYEQRLAPVMEERAAAIAAEETAFGLEREGARLPPTMERLSERQLGGFREIAAEARTEATAGAEGLTGERASLELARGELEQRAQGIEAQRADIESMRQQSQAAQERANALPEPSDRATQSRLAAVEADLEKQNISARRRAALEAERAQIVETLGGPRAAEMARERASLEQEAAALTKAANNQQKALDKAAKKHARDLEKLQTRSAAAEREAAQLEPRAQSKVDDATASLRKSINKLAHDGYDVRLTQDEANALAESIINAPDAEAADRAVRGVTETLVDRRQQAQRAAPAEAGRPFGESEPVRQTRERANYHVDQMRKNIQALARQVGYEMPKEEAAELAAHLHAGTEQDALRTLDELMLRPRTITETLPGTQAAAALVGDVERTLRTVEKPPIPVDVTERDGFRDTWRAENKFGWVSASADPSSKVVQIQASNLKPGTPIGEGHGTELYRAIIDKALADGYTVESSRAVSVDARRLYDGLQRKGYTVETVNPEGTKGSREPVYRITAGPPNAEAGIVPLGPKVAMVEQPWLEAMRGEMRPENIEKMQTSGELDETVLRDLDRLRAERGDLQIPMGETIGPRGERVVNTRTIESVLNEADERIAAAREIEACVGPQKEAAE
jgi:hypothetical protein